MLLFSFICFTVFTTLYAQHNNKTGDDLSSRIWFGERANIKDYPFFAALANCGAVILSEWWLATAAHCVESVSVYNQGNKVWLGKDRVRTTQPYTLNQVIIYPHYWKVFNAIPVNDIALLELTVPLRFSNNVKPVKLPPTQEYERNAIYTVVAMGTDENGESPNHLMKINVRTLREKECLSYLPWWKRWMLKPHLDQIKPVTICTSRMEDLPGVCFGDSGSPLVQGNTLVGIASYIDDGNCAKSRLGMYTNVAPFLGWIKSVTGIQ